MLNHRSISVTTLLREVSEPPARETITDSLFAISPEDFYPIVGFSEEEQRKKAIEIFLQFPDRWGKIAHEDEEKYLMQCGKIPFRFTTENPAPELQIWRNSLTKFHAEIRKISYLRGRRDLALEFCDPRGWRGIPDCVIKQHEGSHRTLVELKFVANLRRSMNNYAWKWALQIGAYYSGLMYCISSLNVGEAWIVVAHPDGPCKIIKFSPELLKNSLEPAWLAVFEEYRHRV